PCPDWLTHGEQKPGDRESRPLLSPATRRYDHRRCREPRSRVQIVSAGEEPLFAQRHLNAESSRPRTGVRSVPDGVGRACRQGWQRFSRPDIQTCASPNYIELKMAQVENGRDE